MALEESEKTKHYFEEIMNQQCSSAPFQMLVFILLVLTVVMWISWYLPLYFHPPKKNKKKKIS